MKEQNIINNILPYGEKLRVLLAHSELSSSNHKSILNSKGVFLSEYEKNETVPTLMTLLLDPIEYTELVEMQSQKEDKVKYRTLQLPWKGGSDLLKVIPEDLNLNNLIKENTGYKPTFKVVGSPTFKRVEGDKNEIKLDYIIERENNTKGWDERKTRHDGSITLTTNESGMIQLVTKKTHTSKETYDVGEYVLSNLKSYFKKNQYIDKEADYERILFSHFINENRIKFFFGFTGELNKSISFEKLTNITIGPDSDIPPHNDLKEFLKDIENLKIKGKALQTHMLISEQKYHNELIFSSMTARYKFIYAEGTGYFDIEFVFNDYENLKGLNSEFQFHIQKIVLDKGYKQSSDKKKISKLINSAIEVKKLELYNNFKA